LNADKVYKVGQEVECVILDCDTNKAILDLSERLAQTSKSKKTQFNGTNQKAFVELSKDNYLVVTLKADRSKIAACILHPFNSES
jgi:ribosomal protein S1